MPMILITLLFAGSVAVVDNQIAADSKPYPIDERCYDENGKFDQDLGADDLDCANLDPSLWK